jgi:phosphohistidine phosphatase
MLCSTISRTLLLLRHGEAVAQRQDDFTRSLSAIGRQECQQLQLFFADPCTFLPELILVSTAKRTEETYEAIAHLFSDYVTVHKEHQLYLATTQELLQRIEQIEDRYRIVMIIGHNPGLSQLVQRLSNKVHVPGLETGELCVLQSEIITWQEIQKASWRCVS